MEYTKLIETISQKTGLSVTSTQAMLDALLSTLNDEAAAGRAVEITDFGSFEILNEPAKNLLEEIIVDSSLPKNLDIKKTKLPKKILSLIPQHMAKQYNLAPVALENGQLTIIALGPVDEEIINLLTRRTGLKIECLIGDIYDLEHVWEQYNNL